MLTSLAGGTLFPPTRPRWVSGGHPQSPSKEGSALSGLSLRGGCEQGRNEVDLLTSLAGGTLFPPARPRGVSGGHPQTPSKEGSALSGLSLRGGCEQGRNEVDLLTSLAGGTLFPPARPRGVSGGHPQSPAREDKALSGLSLCGGCEQGGDNHSGEGQTLRALKTFAFSL